MKKGVSGNDYFNFLVQTSVPSVQYASILTERRDSKISKLLRAQLNLKCLENLNNFSKLTAVSPDHVGFVTMKEIGKLATSQIINVAEKFEAYDVTDVVDHQTNNGLLSKKQGIIPNNSLFIKVVLFADEDRIK